MFKSLEDTGLRGFLEGTTYVFENAVAEFFANAKVIAGTIAGSFDTVTCEKFEFIVAISAGLSVNWDRILFQRLLSMVQNPKAQSQGYTVSVSMLMETLVKADLGASIKLHSQNVLTSKSMQSYIKKNQDIAPEGETSKRAEDTASNTEVSMPHQEEPAAPESLAAAKEKGVKTSKKRNQMGGGQKKQTKNVTKTATQTVERQSVEDRRPVAPTNFDFEEVSEPDSCPLDFVKRRRTQRQHQHMGWTGITIASQPDPIPVSPTEEARISGQDNPKINSGEQERIEFDNIVQGGGDDCFGDDLEFDARMEHEGQKDQEITADEREGSHYDSIPTVPVEGEGDFDDEHLAIGSKEPEKADHEQDAQMGNDVQTANHGCETQLDFMNPVDNVSDDIRNEPAPVEEYCQLLITSAWENVSARMTIFEEWLHFRKDVRIKDISSFEPLVTIEEQLVEWGETEEVSDLFERHSLIMYKLFELELEKLYHKHLYQAPC
ncbi:benzyl alcohol O-benzoyltransferase-like [Dorcoceras hygrometricum]|uniref:Benzyl alcohol O-benzoyltransferase-like n=1 Tax=Dorcoceras hygrometricum TaxID=472368 RepID=A0A2Z7CVS2_9LAMI|nr:benzyl alcohol O-benzoyltransferase-like [Dorcoceras hygrometricum]